MPHDFASTLESLLPALRKHANETDQAGSWPEEDVERLAGAGLLRAALPENLGGAGTSALEQHLVYEAIARGSLALALILSQHDAAVGLIAGSEAPGRAAALEAIAGGALATVGVAQITTSRQGGAPVLEAVADEAGYRVRGLVPWSTGAAKAQFVVTAAASVGGEPILFLLPTDSRGLTIDPPLPLVALRSTWTTSMHLRDVFVPHEAVLRRPGEKVLTRPNHLPLGQAFLAMGLCRGALDLIREHSSPAASAAYERFDAQLTTIRARVLELCDPQNEAASAEETPAVRGQCNELAVRLTHAAVALYKGTALLAGHPAQRLAREAMFLLVWSCPNPVIDCTVEMLSAG